MVDVARYWTASVSGRLLRLPGIGMLAKGPVAPFLAAAIIVLYSLAVRELRLIVRTLWLPGFLLFGAIALPWYVAVQARNPQFLRVFILEHNLARFSTDIYHHTQPLWYYLPVTLLALFPGRYLWSRLLLRAYKRGGQHHDRLRKSRAGQCLAPDMH